MATTAKKTTAKPAAVKMPTGAAAQAVKNRATLAGKTPTASAVAATLAKNASRAKTTYTEREAVRARAVAAGKKPTTASINKTVAKNRVTAAQAAVAKANADAAAASNISEPSKTEPGGWTTPGSPYTSPGVLGEGQNYQDWLDSRGPNVPGARSSTGGGVGSRGSGGGGTRNRRGGGGTHTRGTVPLTAGGPVPVQPTGLGTAGSTVATSSASSVELPSYLRDLIASGSGRGKVRKIG